jgi:hypothetical protein
MIGRLFCKLNLHAYVVVLQTEGATLWVCGRHGCREAGQWCA